MGAANFLRQGSGGQVLMTIEEIPSKGFINAIKVRDVCKARILSGEEKVNVKPGGPDVRIVSATGEVSMISRKDLVSKYRHSNGRKIIIAFLKNSKDYIVTTNSNEEYKVLKMPSNCSGNLRGKQVKSGSYIVCKKDADGNPDMTSISIVQPSLFKKMFKVPMQDLIKRYMGKTGSTVTNVFNRSAIRKNSKPVSTSINQSGNTDIRLNKFNLSKPSMIDTSELGINPKNIKVNTVVDTRNTSNKYRFTAVNKLMSMQNPKQHVGFMIKDLQTGVTKQCTIIQVTKLCEQKLVDNIILVQKENGVRYLKGNGIVMENLPQILV